MSPEKWDEKEEMEIRDSQRHTSSTEGYYNWPQVVEIRKRCFGTLG